MNNGDGAGGDDVDDIGGGDSSATGILACGSDKMGLQGRGGEQMISAAAQSPRATATTIAVIVAATTVVAQSVILDRESPPPPSPLGPLGGLMQGLFFKSLFMPTR
ncbi:hypothetical protein Syun_021011 [Stephania yunnanensis]|uniref:Uncharacterized protein n=1 Tax=Stephania yunnanensis TaxID=152371 RepID=A0AAP0IEY5_9MAGN